MSGLFAVNKPSGISSAGLLNDLQNTLKKSPLFEVEIKAQQARTNAGRKGRKQKMGNKIKMGHGGTLDPLASGVLVVGTGRGTKDLGQFLSCSKDYEAVALFGCSTDTYDSDGKIVHRKPWKHITRELLESTLSQFRGDIMQTPPIYSALKMEGKPLYEYAREGKPLPKEIQARPANVSRFEITRFTTEHEWAFPKEMASEDIVLSAEVLEQLRPQNRDLTSGPLEIPSSQQPVQGAKDPSLSSDATEDPRATEPPSKRAKLAGTESADPDDSPSGTGAVEGPLAIHIDMTVSSGTYVRSLIHDLGLAVGSAAHMVALVRKRVGEFRLEDAISWEAFETDKWQDSLVKKLNLDGQETRIGRSVSRTEPEEAGVSLPSLSDRVARFLHPCQPFRRTLTYAQSLDAKISGPMSRPLVISCPESFRVTHELRRAHDLILVGVGTALHDDPGLNARDTNGKPFPLDEQPVPIIVDPNGRLQLQASSKLMSNFLKKAGKRPVQLVHSSKQGQVDTTAAVIFINSQSQDSTKFTWSEIFEAIRQLGDSVMIEGGATVIQDVLREKAADQVIVTVAPKYVGEGTPIALSEPVSLTAVRVETFGRDSVIAGRLSQA